MASAISRYNEDYTESAKEVFMRALTATAIVRADHTLMMQVPADIPCGPYQAVVVLDAPSVPATPTPAEWRLPVHDVGPWPEGVTLRREDSYGDDGR